MVKTLVSFEVENLTTAGQVPVTITANPEDVIQGKKVVLTADIDLGRYDEIVEIKRYSSTTDLDETNVAAVEAATAVANSTNKRSITVASAPDIETWYYCKVTLTKDTDGFAQLTADNAEMAAGIPEDMELDNFTFKVFTASTTTKVKIWNL